MSDFEECRRHGLPADLCGPCNAALEERQRIIELLKQEFGEEYYDMGVCGLIVKLIKGEDNAPEIPQFEGTRGQLNALTVKGDNG
jgi:hypothetical protein